MKVAAVRHFNRFYTKQMGVLDEKLLKSPFSLTEVRVLYEIHHQERPSASDIAKALSLDAGYLSRILTGLEKRGLVLRQPSPDDGRQTHLILTAEGEATFGDLDSATNAEVARMLADIAPADQGRMVDAMRTIERAFRPPENRNYVLRPHQPGDMGWVIHRHGALYAREYGWDEQFEALVAEIAARFIQNFDPKRERCWIAEIEGAIVGSVFLVKSNDEVAKLRLLYVEPETRGLGIGGRLVHECIRFARQVGYKKITLWTQDVLDAARHIYRKSGFQLVAREPNELCGHKMHSETWELSLCGGPVPRASP